METLDKKQITDLFKKNNMCIKVSDCQKSDNGMIFTLHEHYGVKMFTSYLCAYDYYHSKGII